MPKVSERGYRRATRAVRAYDDEWELIQKFMYLTRKDMATAYKIFDSIKKIEPKNPDTPESVRETVRKEHKDSLVEYTALKNLCKNKGISMNSYVQYLIVKELQKITKQNISGNNES